MPSAQSITKLTIQPSHQPAQTHLSQHPVQQQKQQQPLLLNLSPSSDHQLKQQEQQLHQQQQQLQQTAGDSSNISHSEWVNLMTSMNLGQLYETQTTA